MRSFYHTAEIPADLASKEPKLLNNIQDLQIRQRSKNMQLKALSYFEEKMPLSKHGTLLKNCLRERISDIVQLEQNVISKIQLLNREK